MSNDIHSLVKDNIEVYSVPTIYASLNIAINNPRGSLTEIAKIISADQGLTSRMLKLANSPLYGFPSKIETISQAVVIIGTKQIRDLALATSVTHLFQGIPEGLVSMETFWSHSVACGVIARVIAGYQRKPNIERFFTAGIMHDIGRLIIFSTMPEKYKRIMYYCRKEKKSLFDSECEKIGFSHADVGDALLKKWKLPSDMVELVVCHHEPLKAVGNSGEAAVINIADIIAHALQIGASGELFVPPLDESAWRQLALPLGMLQYVIEQSLQQFDIAVGLILPETKK